MEIYIMHLNSEHARNRAYVTHGAGGAGSGGSGTVYNIGIYIPESPDIMRKKIIAYMAVSAWINCNFVVMPIGSRFCNISFDNLDLNSAIFDSSAFLKCSFKNTYLPGARFTNCEMLDCLFHDTYLVNTVFYTCNILRGSFHLDMFGTCFYDCNLDTKIFEAKLHNTTIFSGSTIKNRELATQPLVATFDRGDHIFRLICFKKGPPMIEAGCRWMTWKEYWSHTRTYYDAVKKTRTRAILKLFKVYLQTMEHIHD